MFAVFAVFVLIPGYIVGDHDAYIFGWWDLLKDKFIKCVLEIHLWLFHVLQWHTLLCGIPFTTILPIYPALSGLPGVFTVIHSHYSQVHDLITCKCSAIYENQKEDRPQTGPCETPIMTGTAQIFSTDNRVLWSTRQEGLYPVSGVLVDASWTKFVNKAVTWNFIGSFTKSNHHCIILFLYPGQHSKVGLL